MTTPTTPETGVYQPSAAQKERAAALRRFNQLYVSVPAMIAGVIWILLVGLLLWGAFSSKVVGTREFASGLADIILILSIIPLLLLCAIPPGMAIAYVVYRNQKRESRPAHSGLQRLLWRVDNLVNRIQQQMAKTLPKATRPLIAAHALAAFWHEFMVQAKRMIKWN